MRCSKQMKHSTQNLVSISLMENLQGKYLNLYWIKSKHYFKILFSYKQSSKFVIFFYSDRNILADSRQECSTSDEENESSSKSDVLQPHRKRPLSKIEHSEHPPRKKLKFLPLKQSGMTVCADHGWQKKGFDSLTGSCQIYLWLFIFLKITVTLVGLYFMCK